MSNIQIRADVDVSDANICRFTVDRPVHSGTDAYESKEEAKDNPLAGKLFNIPGISRVELADNVVTVSKASHDDWRVIGKRIGSSIRSFLEPPPEAPEGDTLPSEALRAKVQQLLDEQINPGVASHGGFVELIDVEDNNVYLRLGGGCQGCGAADVTLKMGIERMIREEIPQITQVLDVTDHAAGQNPYYAPAK